ncbi:hypothetical protein ACWE42_12455 [Sutcliffiella cohnii]|uniref:Uncharacterized protein n=1 Tax=Sutcliffiella cohnii TaxID=33932 RepID=A0A223KMG1_9BACI|nr:MULTISPECIES: hypothetical protein [Sutcliffiella]AST90671.1 hypothetical protein BC6307_04920 [Sutcliffiella cohnii]WBL16324.1 hypothetical protein O1A01_06740 [Sutcliffiella sp. NC1]
MGYVLPINQNTYHQYANRTNAVNEKTNTMVDPVRKAIFYKVNPQYNWEELQKQRRQNKDKWSKEAQAVPTKKRVNCEIIADITGKGQLFNETI